MYSFFTQINENVCNSTNISGCIFRVLSYVLRDTCKLSYPSKSYCAARHTNATDIISFRICTYVIPGRFAWNYLRIFPKYVGVTSNFRPRLRARPRVQIYANSGRWVFVHGKNFLLEFIFKIMVVAIMDLTEFYNTFCALGKTFCCNNK